MWSTGLMCSSHKIKPALVSSFRRNKSHTPFRAAKLCTNLQKRDRIWFRRQLDELAVIVSQASLELEAFSRAPQTHALFPWL